MADASKVTSQAENLKDDIDSLAGKFTEDVIYSSEGASMSNAETSIKTNGEENTKIIIDAANEIERISKMVIK